LKFHYQLRIPFHRVTGCINLNCT